MRLVAFTQNALRIEVFAYAKVSDQDKFLKVQEAVFLGILEIVENAGASFASPLPPLAPPPDLAEKAADDGDAQPGKDAPTKAISPDRAKAS